MLYSLDDISIIPAAVSNIESRSECDPYDANGMLPLFVAPMSCIIDDKNWKTFNESEVRTIIPRNISLNIRYELMSQTFVAMSLSEFENSFCKDKIFTREMNYVCLDIANGHMRKAIDLCAKAKRKHSSNLTLMAGNIANPMTYIEYSKAGIDYIRIGIGSGNVCTTSANGGVHYPMASLIEGCIKVRKQMESAIDSHNLYEVERSVATQYYSIPKIVADGGFKNFDQIIKALALGADYVMSGEIFAKSEEACGEIFNGIANCGNRHRMYYGMSTKRAQEEFGNSELKTAEGISKMIEIEYPISKWCDNFIHYLRSGMSYTNSKTISEFQKSKTKVISQASFYAYHK